MYKDLLICSGPKGLFKMNLDTETFSPLFPSGKVYGTTCFFVDSKGYLWLTSNNGVWKINMEKEEDQIHFRLGENGLGTLPVLQIIEDRKSDFFRGRKVRGCFIMTNRMVNLSVIRRKTFHLEQLLL
jgi:ligand-binding sensor domain-containing protein